MRKPEELVRNILGWFELSARDLPWRRTKDPYAIWISEVMLQQTQVKTVIPYWERWMAAFPDVKTLADSDTGRVLKLWEGLGYYSRARNLQRAAREIILTGSGEPPRTFDAWMRLPGVGRYTAGAVCSIAFGEPAPAVDGNVIRLLARLFALEADPRTSGGREAFWTKSIRLVEAAAKAKANVGHLNQALMELGATVCLPRHPKCETCPIRKSCRACREGRVSEYPRSIGRVSPTSRHFVAFVVECQGRYLVRQRVEQKVNAGLWEFPNLEIGPDIKPRRAAEELFGRAPEFWEPFATIKHSITRYRITLEVYRGRFGAKPAAPLAPQAANPAERIAPQAGRVTPRAGRTTLTSCFPAAWIEKAEWHTLKSLEKLAFPSAHKKILEGLRPG